MATATAWLGDESLRDESLTNEREESGLGWRRRRRRCGLEMRADERDRREESLMRELEMMRESTVRSRIKE